MIEDYGADINVLNKEHVTPLHFAASDGHIDVVKTLLSYPQCDVTIETSHTFYRTPLEFAKWRGCKDVVSLLEAKYKGTAATGQRYSYGAQISTQTCNKTFHTKHRKAKLL